jgi:hypothetical protein
MRATSIGSRRGGGDEPRVGPPFGTRAERLLTDRDRDSATSRGRITWSYGAPFPASLGGLRTRCRAESPHTCRAITGRRHRSHGLVGRARARPRSRSRAVLRPHDVAALSRPTGPSGRGGCAFAPWVRVQGSRMAPALRSGRASAGNGSRRCQRRRLSHCARPSGAVRRRRSDRDRSPLPRLSR